jgi:thiol-disulfide isomerase/thioredoxin
MVAAALALALVSPPAAVADDRLQFTGTTLSGASFNGASLVGKPSVLWFWTPWCPFCNAEAPSVSQVAAANPKVTFVGVAARSDVAAMQGFVSKYNINFTNLNDADGSIWARYNVRASALRVLLRGWGVDSREQPDRGDAPAGAVRPGSGAVVGRRAPWTKTLWAWPSALDWWRR